MTAVDDRASVSARSVAGVADSADETAAYGAAVRAPGNGKAGIVSLVLAGGRGSRMRCETTPKVCFEMDGVPAILRALQTYEECGIHHHVIVVGPLGEQVLQTVGPHHPRASFVYQPEPLGTGHAARCGADLLEATGYEGAVLVAVGDRLVAPHVVHRLICAMRDTRSDVVLLTGSKGQNPASGRVVTSPDGNVAAIVEVGQIALSRLVAELETLAAGAVSTVPSQRILDRIQAHFPSAEKAQAACGSLIDLAGKASSVNGEGLRNALSSLREQSAIELWLNGEPQMVPASQVEDMSEDANLSMYLFRAPVLYEALRTLDTDNALGEYLLTDCARLLGQQRYRNGSPRYRLSVLRVEHPDDSVSFNTPEELAEIERRLREDGVRMPMRGVPCSDLDGRLMPAADWHRALSGEGLAVRSFLERIYGPVESLHREKVAALRDAVEHFIEVHGAEREVIVARSPGRVNLMGSHVDHRGGNTNVIAINDEVIMVASPRSDDRITLRNARSSTFATTEFSISRDIADLDWADWLTCVNSPKTLSMVRNGEWSNYVRASALRLQQRFRRHSLRGADIITHGSIPIGSGLSSSSAVVVCTAEVLIALNGLPVRPAILVDLCGEGEWFVGTRGGAADHAAIKFSKRGYIAHVGFFPFEVKEFVPFPAGYCVVVCNSGVAANKGGGARATFNTKILGYVAGEIILKRQWPEAASRVHHLRDITCENLGIELEQLYRGLAQVPQSLSPDELISDWGPLSDEEMAKVNNLLSTLPSDMDRFEVRGVTLYGLAEIARAQKCLGYLKSADVETFGALWYLSHDGDRVVIHDEQLAPAPFSCPVSEDYLDGLTADLQSGDRERTARAQLHLQPGAYGCSTPELDLIVDVARRQAGVAGAQLAGAGLGGCAIVLVRDDCCDALIAALEAHSFAAQRYYPVEGAGLVSIEDAAGP